MLQTHLLAVCSLSNISLCCLSVSILQILTFQACSVLKVILASSQINETETKIYLIRL